MSTLPQPLAQNKLSYISSPLSERLHQLWLFSALWTDQFTHVFPVYKHPEPQGSHSPKPLGPTPHPQLSSKVPLCPKETLRIRSHPLLTQGWVTEIHVSWAPTLKVPAKLISWLWRIPGPGDAGLTGWDNYVLPFAHSFISHSDEDR